jgi:uncharacterized cupin superfamily protein
MIYHFKGDQLELEPVPDDDQHEGPARSAYRSVYESGDGTLHLGFWDFDGEQHTKPPNGVEDGYEEVVILLEGELTIDSDGETYQLGPGDAIVYDCPIGAKRLRSSGFRAAYVIRYRESGESGS